MSCHFTGRLPRTPLIGISVHFDSSADRTGELDAVYTASPRPLVSRQLCEDNRRDHASRPPMLLPDSEVSGNRIAALRQIVPTFPGRS